MADAGDLKSPARTGREGSIPSSAIAVVRGNPAFHKMYSSRWIAVLIGDE